MRGVPCDASVFSNWHFNFPARLFSRGDSRSTAAPVDRERGGEVLHRFCRSIVVNVATRGAIDHMSQLTLFGLSLDSLGVNLEGSADGRLAFLGSGASLAEEIQITSDGKRAGRHGANAKVSSICGHYDSRARSHFRQRRTRHDVQKSPVAKFIAMSAWLTPHGTSISAMNSGDS